MNLFLIIYVGFLTISIVGLIHYYEDKLKESNYQLGQMTKRFHVSQKLRSEIEAENERILENQGYKND